MRGNIHVDVTPAKKKVGKLLGMDRAIIYQAEKWGSQTTKRVQMGIRSTFKAGTGHLWRNVGFRVQCSAGLTRTEVGTGLKGFRPVIYAKIQEKGSGYLPGGVVKPVRAQMLTIPFPGIKGRARNYPNAFIFKSKKGNLILAQRVSTKGGKPRLKPLFLLKDKVKIPASHWLSIPVNEMRPKLFEMMRPPALMGIMSKLPGV